MVFAESRPGTGCQPVEDENEAVIGIESWMALHDGSSHGAICSATVTHLPRHCAYFVCYCLRGVDVLLDALETADLELLPIVYEAVAELASAPGAIPRRSQQQGMTSPLAGWSDRPHFEGILVDSAHVHRIHLGLGGRTPARQGRWLQSSLHRSPAGCCGCQMRALRLGLAQPPRLRPRGRAGGSCVVCCPRNGEVVS